MKAYSILFVTVYFVQGAVVAALFNFTKPYLLEQNLDLKKIGLIGSLAVLPFVIKPLFGVCIDNIKILGQSRKLFFVSTSCLLSFLSFLSVYYSNPNSDFISFLSFLILAVSGLAISDVAVDGFAVTTIPTEKQSQIQSLMWASRSVSLVLFSWGLGEISENWGYRFTYLFLAFLSLLPLLPLAYLKEPVPPKTFTTLPSNPKFFLNLVFNPFFSKRGLLLSLSLVAHTFLFYGGLLALTPLFMKQTLLSSATDIGNVGALRSLGLILGSLLGTYIFRSQWRTPLSVFLVGIGIGGFLFFPHINSTFVLATISATVAFVFGFYQVLLGTWAMGLSKGVAASTLFSLFMGVANIGIMLGESILVTQSKKLGFNTLFAFLAVFMVSLLPALRVFFNEQKLEHDQLLPK